MRDTSTERRRAFYTPSVLLFVLLLTTVTGIIMRTLYSYISDVDAYDTALTMSTLSDIGLKRGEDWLLTSINSGGVPVTTALKRIDECCADKTEVFYSCSQDVMGAFDGRSYYFLRSTATDQLSGVCVTCEELIALSADISGRVVDVRRLFYRTK